MMLRSKILMLIRKILMVRIPEISITIFVISFLAGGAVGILFSRAKPLYYICIAKRLFIPHFPHFPHWPSVWEVWEVWVVFLFGYPYARARGMQHHHKTISSHSAIIDLPRHGRNDHNCAGQHKYYHC